MSEQPDNNGGSEGSGSNDNLQAGGQAQGGQPQGGQAGSGQAGGQAGGGQAQGGQHGHAQGQPQGGYQGQQQVQTGPSVGDIFSRPDTMSQIKLGVVLFALVGVGAGLALFGVGNSFAPSGGGGGGFAGALAGAVLGPAMLVVPIAFSVVVAVFLGFRQEEALEDTPDNLVYATAAVTSAIGALVAFLISWILGGLGVGNVSFNGVFVPMLMTAIGAAVVAAGIIWTVRSFMQSSGPQAAQQQY